MTKLLPLTAVSFALLAGCVGNDNINPQPNETIGEAVAEPTDGLENEITTSDD